MTTPPTIVILDGYTINPGDNPWSPVEALGTCLIHDRTPPELKLERARDADIILTSKCKLDAATLESLPRLKYISMLATGYNNVDVVAAGKRGIPVSNVPAYSTESVVQTTFALLLELATAVGVHDTAVKAGEWVSCPDHSFWKSSILELDGLTLGIVGYGTIGRAVAGLLAVMKPSALLINVARGGLVNEADLARALRDGMIAGAGLDVVAQEPMRADNPLLSAPNCIFTPHIAWASLAARRRLMTIVAANVASYLSGAPVNLVNVQHLK